MSILASDVIKGFSGPDRKGRYVKADITVPVGILYRDGVKLRKGVLANLTENEWYWVSNRLYLGFDPEKHLIEAGQRSSAIDTNGGAYLTIKNLTLGHANSNWKASLLAYENGTDINISNVVVQGSAHAGIWVKGADNVKISNSTIINCDDNCIELSSDYGETDLLISGNEVINCGNRGILIQDYSNVNVYSNVLSHNGKTGIEWIAKTQDSVSGARIYSNTLNNITVQGIQTGGARDKTAMAPRVYSNRISNIFEAGADGYCIDIDIGTLDGHFYYNYCVDAAEAGIATIGETTQGNKVYYNIIARIGRHGDTSQAAMLSGSGASNNEWYNNTIYDSHIGISLANDSKDHFFKNNIIYGSSLYHVEVEGASFGTFDYNVYYPDTSNSNYRFMWKGSDVKDFVDWQALSMQDENSLISNPLFVDGALGKFWLRKSSPAIDAGVYLGEMFSYGLRELSSWPYSVKSGAQGEYGHGWEIGAFIFLP